MSDDMSRLVDEFETAVVELERALLAERDGDHEHERVWTAKRNLLAALRAPAQAERASGAGGEALREGLTILLVSAQSAEAARVDQMHSHLDTGHPAARTDGMAAQIHGLYAQAIAQLLDPAPADAGAEL